MEDLRSGRTLFVLFLLLGINLYEWSAQKAALASQLSPQDKQLLTRLDADWAARRKAVLTAHLKFYLFHLPTLPLPRLEFLELLRSANLMANPRNIEALSQRLAKPPKPGVRTFWRWTKVDLWQDGERCCEIDRGEGDEGYFTFTKTEDMQISYDSHNTAAGIHPAGDRQFPVTASIDNYCYVPPTPTQHIASVVRSNEGIVITGEKSPQGYHSELTIDESTGMARV